MSAAAIRCSLRARQMRCTTCLLLAKLASLIRFATPVRSRMLCDDDTEPLVSVATYTAAIQATCHRQLYQRSKHVPVMISLGRRLLCSAAPQPQRSIH